ncbi:16S rRNA (uracil(1498)-N(3))-methyltransferase [Psychrobacter sp. 28M-43]|uniref:16S rRNA (uracil(1498)-N(3))-methyltransferase n=1 Tax=Psychrobacter sp. 28M-43 TaxID=2772254 RepID=UPI00168CBC50|nr:16S rRNA (uracil(1498)-N(3))-methyltransferase [Psychrobacter sp. 28M-43]QOD13390.1 16S rRNA (uracil(1498)-N(3))-methyltransferase [Psychrobacter sp. 28M-43]
MNCILLPTKNLSADAAKIDALSQVSHVTKVLGAKIGDTLKIGQIGGNLGSAVIEDITAASIQLSNVQLNTVPPAKLDLTVILALPRPKVLRRLIMDMTALGVRDIILINSYRTQKSYWQSPMLERIDEFVLEGLQQSIDTIVPSITLQKRFKPFVEDSLASLMSNPAIVAHPYSQQSFSEFLQQQPSRELPSIVCIGAEGGWIDYEIELLSAQGCTPVHIGSRILRTEAAVNAILGQWLL